MTATGTGGAAELLSLVLVDDSEDVRYLVRMILSRDPRVEIVAEASDAAGGLSAAARLEPDVVVLDIGLRDRSGLGLISELKQAAPLTQVIVLTGDHRPELNAAVVAAGAYAYVAKRDAFSQLLAVVSSLHRPVYVERGRPRK